MCGIAGIMDLDRGPYDNLAGHLQVMNTIQAHRGPDDENLWTHDGQSVGFAHRRLSIIDLESGTQPMTDAAGNTICYNGEIYNYIELREELKGGYSFRTNSDTEVILAAYEKWGVECVQHLRGMFAFAIWDGQAERLFCARDRFGIKPFYYTTIDGVFYFASETKTLLPFLADLKTDLPALQEYLVFQLCLEGKTLFADINELPAGHRLVVKNGAIRRERYWEVYYNLDWNHTHSYFRDELRSLIEDSVSVHTRSDVPIGAYVSGGLDSSIVASLASSTFEKGEFDAFTGKFSLGELYDESEYARILAEARGFRLYETDIQSADFASSIEDVIYHLDYPVAGPGSFPQFHVSKLASQHRKVVLGGQGGDEIFGGYVRYLIAYFEQCIKGAIDGTLNKGRFVVTYESIIPNLRLLQNYKPLLKHFFRDGLFEDLDRRYYRLVDKAPSLQDEIDWDALGDGSPFETFRRIFNGSNVGSESYFDKMTHFDFKTLLPALLHVEDRMSMAHGLESRVPFLDHPVVEFAATMPANIKFQGGTLKMILKNAMRHTIPDEIANRTNKMGFPVPLQEWFAGDLKSFLEDIFGSKAARERPYFNNDRIRAGLTSESQFGRKVWGLLSLELWHRVFHDRHHAYKSMLKSA